MDQDDDYIECDPVRRTRPRHADLGPRPERQKGEPWEAYLDRLRTWTAKVERHNARILNRGRLPRRGGMDAGLEAFLARRLGPRGRSEP